MHAEALTGEFDAVLMLTWSDWWTEPRSNRYHYATRFANYLPTLFFQHKFERANELRVRQTERPNLDIVQVSCGVNQAQVDEIVDLLRVRGIRRPLLWVYDSMNYNLLIDALPRAFLVYHATEDYLLHSSGWGLDSGRVAEAVIQLLGKVDHVVACAPGVARSCRENGTYEGSLSIVENGCDAAFYANIAATMGTVNGRQHRTVIYQGGINQRLDFDLLIALVRAMPDWEFEFCGRHVETPGWAALRKFRNVRYLGELDADALGAAMVRATVGIIPFIQDQWINNSWPLKAYEYVACGLPVVTVPIAALSDDPALFRVGTTADEFRRAILEVAEARFEQAELEKRRASALHNSYDSRFEKMANSLCAASRRVKGNVGKLKVAVLYDGTGSLHVSTIREHLEAFEKYSRHDITFISATQSFWQCPAEKLDGVLDFNVFDAIVVHYSIRTSVAGHLDEGVARAISRFKGLKILFIQDEYDNVELTRTAMEKLGFDVVYTCVPTAGLDYVYPRYRFPSTDFLPTLTGYVPEAPEIEGFALPMDLRQTAIAYRGRKLPHIYGQLGQEKYRIGVEMKRLAELRGAPVDIEVDDSKRIYGSDWYRFLGSARATLGTESGSNVFDIDGGLLGRIERAIAENPGRSAEEVVEEVLVPYEGRVRMNQISPKIFEAIRLRTALVLFEGEYSGVVQADIHYIPLKKDFSNADEVFEKLADTESLLRMTERAYDDVVASGRYSYARFVADFDRDMQARIHRTTRRKRLLGPWWLFAPDGQPIEAVPAMPVGLWRGPHPLARPLFVSEMVDGNRSLAVSVLRAIKPAIDTTRGLRVGSRVVRRGVGLLWRSDSPRLVGLRKAARRVWRTLPIAVRMQLATVLLRVLGPVAHGNGPGAPAVNEPQRRVERPELKSTQRLVAVFKSVYRRFGRLAVRVRSSVRRRQD